MTEDATREPLGIDLDVVPDPSDDLPGWEDFVPSDAREAVGLALLVSGVDDAKYEGPGSKMDMVLADMVLAELDTEGWRVERVPFTAPYRARAIERHDSVERGMLAEHRHDDDGRDHASTPHHHKPDGSIVWHRPGEAPEPQAARYPGQGGPHEEDARAAASGPFAPRCDCGSVDKVFHRPTCAVIVWIIRKAR